MPYRPGLVPRDWTPAFIRRELQRVSEAYDFTECFGGLHLVFLDPNVEQTLTTTPQVMNCWVNVSPDPDVGDGPVLTEPLVSPTGTIQVFERGIFLLTFYVNYTHDPGTEIEFEMYLNGSQTGLGSVIDASQQSRASSTSFSAMFTLKADDVIDVRATSPDGNEDIEWNSSAVQVYKLRDVRTRFS